MDMCSLYFTALRIFYDYVDVRDFYNQALWKFWQIFSIYARLKFA